MKGELIETSEVYCCIFVDKRFRKNLTGLFLKYSALLYGEQTLQKKISLSF